jgi:hypothetical protein
MVMRLRRKEILCFIANFAKEQNGSFLRQDSSDDFDFASSGRLPTKAKFS